jgi:hypothetical protein
MERTVYESKPGADVLLELLAAAHADRARVPTKDDSESRHRRRLLDEVERIVI